MLNRLTEVMAIESLRRGGLVVFPTETRYCLGCRAGDDEAVARLLRAKHRPDGKPLPVGGYSHDPDSRWGKALRSFQRGYKLFAVWGRSRMPLAWRVAPLNVSEQAMAQEMLPELAGDGGYVLGDKLYDINKLYDAAAAVGHQLVADRKRAGKGLGHCRHSPARLRALELLGTKFGRELYVLRDRIERRFASLTNYGGGLAPLPAWVRRITRVKLWVQAKLILHALRPTTKEMTAV